MIRLLLTIAWCLGLAGTAQSQDIELTAAQRQWVAAHRIVLVAPAVDLLPIDGIDNAGRQTGLSADYLKLIAIRSGLEFRVKRLASHADVLRALREHRIDVVPAAVVNGDKDVLFTAPYLRVSAAIYARGGEPGFADLAQLAGHAIGVADASPWSETLAQRSSTRLTRFPTIAAALQAVRDKSIDAYVGDPFTAASAIGQLKADKDIVLSGQVAMEAALGFAVRADAPQLRAILDAALASIGVDEEKALRERWLKNATVAIAAPSADRQALPPSQAPAIEAALKALPKARGPSADERKQIDDILHQGQDDETAGDELAAQWKTLAETAAIAEGEAQKLEDAQATSDAGAQLAWRSALPERSSVDQLEALLGRERDNLASAKAAAATLQAEVERQTARPAQIRTELTGAQAILDARRPAAAAVNPGDPLSQARALRDQAAERKATIQVALLNLETRSYEPRMRLLVAQLRDKQRAVSDAAQHVAALESLVLDRTGAAVAEMRTRVTQERDRAIAQFRALGEAANVNLALVDKLDGAVRDLAQLRPQKQDWETWQRDTAQALKNTEERIRIGGVNEAVGLILLAEKARLKPLPVLRRALAKLQTDLAQTRMSLIDLREQQDALVDVGAAVTQTLARLPEPPPERLNDLRTNVYRLLNTRAEILPSLLAQQTRLAAADGEAEQTLSDLVATTEKLGAVLDARLLWTPSQKPVDASWLTRLPADGARFFAPQRWLRVARNIGQAAAQEFLFAIASLAALGLLFAVRQRAPKQLEAIAAPMRRIRSDSYRQTGKAVLWTVIRALPVPALVWLIAFACRQAAGTGNGNLTEEVGIACAGLVAPAFALSFLRALVQPSGLAHLHFRWPRPRRQALHDAAPWLALCVLPAQFVLGLLLMRGDAAAIDTLGRALLAGAVIGIAALTWQLFAPGRVWTSRDAQLVEPLRLRQATRVSLTTGCVLMAVLVLRGFFVTVVALAGHVLLSLGMLLAVATAHGLAVRWLVLGERRLALKRMQEKQAAEASAEEQADGDSLPEAEPEEITLASVSLQTRRLLRALTIFVAIAALLWIWSEVTPAVTMLDQIPVWKDQHVSLLGVFEAFVVLTLTWIATRNLPGLIEVGLLRRIHIDAPTRYAVTSVTRYIIVFAGTIGGLSLLGLQWSNLQWLAAGFSVGLGFGMQEIFANFISGLMVLFERPFRVGDIITIGNIDGVVSRIRTRATTLVDWENKEILVPNKSFITERLVNWTLSDTITRIAVKVGIAYGNDARQAQQLLLDIAGAHPLVLDDPAPTCWMTGFGDSSQNLELRVCVAEIGQRASVGNDLQMRIAEVFRDNGIEIAFPQMDLWLRNEAALQRAQSPGPPAAGSAGDSPRSGSTERRGN